MIQRREVEVNPLGDRGLHPLTQHLLLTAASEDKSQYTLYLDRQSIDGCRFKDQFSRRLHRCAPQREVAADRPGLNDESLF